MPANSEQVVSAGNLIEVTCNLRVDVEFRERMFKLEMWIGSQLVPARPQVGDVQGNRSGRTQADNKWIPKKNILLRVPVK